MTHLMQGFLAVEGAGVAARASRLAATVIGAGGAATIPGLAGAAGRSRRAAG